MIKSVKRRLKSSLAFGLSSVVRFTDSLNPRPWHPPMNRWAIVIRRLRRLLQQSQAAESRQKWGTPDGHGKLADEVSQSKAGRSNRRSRHRTRGAPLCHVCHGKCGGHCRSASPPPAVTLRRVLVQFEVARASCAWFSRRDARATL